MVEGKFLKITGRIKEQYKLENGKYVVPAPLEDAMTRSIFIAQCLLYGDNKKYNVSILISSFVVIVQYFSYLFSLLYTCLNTLIWLSLLSSFYCHGI
jgi:long-subunit acyl-CoA synthetase (AMP-forming)